MGNMTTLQILQGVHDWVLDKIDEETANFITKTVNDLVNYYTKSETYTKAEVQQIVDAIKQFTYEVVQVLPSASASTMNKIYLVPAPKSEDKNVKEEYITIQDGSTYSWEMLGTTSIDLSNYYTKGQTDSAISSALSSALASYTTTADLTTLLAQKQDVIQDLADIRSGASAGSTAVQPSTLNNAVKNVVAESGVYDVSANNDNTKFESLSALLSSANLNTLIPTDIRKGGMSIKFVLSSDNIYVQYMLMATSFSITPSDWQKISTVLFERYISTELLQNKYITTTGGIDTSGSGAAVIIYKIEKKLGKIHITIPKTGNNATKVIAFGDSVAQTSQLETLQYVGNSSSFDTEIEITESTKDYLFICFSYSSGEPAVVQNIPLIDVINKNTEDIESIKEKDAEQDEAINNISTIDETIDYKCNELAVDDFSSYRIACNTDYVFNAGDKLKKVILYSKERATNTYVSQLYVYGSNNVRKKTVSLGVVNTSQPVVFDVSSSNIVLEQGDKIAIQGAWWKSKTGATNIYDYTTNAILNGYQYCFDLEIERKVTIKDEISEIKTELSDIDSNIQELDGRVSALEQKKTLKILCIGNSFTQDSMAYVPAVMQLLAPDVEVKIGIAYIGGSPLPQHLANLKNANVTYDGITYSPQNYTFYETKPSNAGWYSGTTKSIDQCLSNKAWDIITFQQSGTYADKTYLNNYVPYIAEIHNLVLSKVNHSFKFGWILTHSAYVSNADDFATSFVNIANNAVKVMNETLSDVLFNYGTAVQSLRTTSASALGDDSLHNLLVDGAHLQEGIGCLCAAYLNALVMCEYIGRKVSCIGKDITVDTSFITTMKIPGPNLGTGVIGNNPAYIRLAQIAAETAFKNRYSISDISYYEEV